MHNVEQRIEKARAMYCMNNCPYAHRKDCVDCLASKDKRTRRKVLKHMLSIGIPEDMAREMIIGGKNL